MDIAAIRTECLKELEQICALSSLEAFEIKVTGRKGILQDLMSRLKEVAREEKPLIGKKINDFKVEIEAGIQEKHALLSAKAEEEKIQKEWIDITLPGSSKKTGAFHPVTQMMRRILEIFREMGFSVQLGPDIDTDFYNFEALNFPEDHPARDMQDTFYLPEAHLLRTHTSNTQVRLMEIMKPPIRVVVPGNAYRNETVTARSHVQFHQVEGFYIDPSATFSDLLGTLEFFFRRLLGADVEMRFRPSYFPFVEPGVEVDISCFLCKNEGCAVCKHTGWLEVAGAGMIHPEVLSCGGINPEEFQGYAWGMGVERLVLLQNGIPDIRLLFQNDMRFLKQFPSDIVI